MNKAHMVGIAETNADVPLEWHVIQRPGDVQGSLQFTNRHVQNNSPSYFLFVFKQIVYRSLYFQILQGTWDPRYTFPTFIFFISVLYFSYSKIDF